MGIFDFLGGKKSRVFETLDDAAKHYAFGLFSSAYLPANILNESENEEKLTYDQYWDLIVAFAMLMYHISDRQAFVLLGEDKRDEFTNPLAANLSQLIIMIKAGSYDDQILFTNNTDFNKIMDNGSNKISNDDFKKKSFELISNMDNVSSKLSQYKKLFPSGDEGQGGCLIWEFSNDAAKNIFKDRAELVATMTIYSCAASTLDYIKLLDQVLEGF